MTSAEETKLEPSEAEPTMDTTRHPIRGGLYGLLLGVGVSLLLVGQAKIAFGSGQLILVVVLFVVAGTLWGAFAPAKKRDMPAPAAQILE